MCTVDFELWHLELITGLVVLVSSCRYLLLKTWPDFAESSEAANQQVAQLIPSPPPNPPREKKIEKHNRTCHKSFVGHLSSLLMAIHILLLPRVCVYSTHSPYWLSQWYQEFVFTQHTAHTGYPNGRTHKSLLNSTDMLFSNAGTCFS